VNSLMLMLHAGGRFLDDMQSLRLDKALRYLLGLKHVPAPVTIGQWLRRLGQDESNAIEAVNQRLNQVALHRCRAVTLDIDATFMRSWHSTAQWSYLKAKGYMPMTGFIAQTDSLIACEFRPGNVAPATDNLNFLQQCEAALPKDVRLAYFRCDAAGYQVAIVEHCIAQGIGFAIRAKLTANLRDQIAKVSTWSPLIDRDGKEIEDASTCRFVHLMQQSTHAFTLVVQRQLKRTTPSSEEAVVVSDEESFEADGYVYRAIATNRDALSDSELIHWYNQRAEACENRIKELKRDFGGDQMPCQYTAANAAYFGLCGLAYNLFVLLRSVLPAHLERVRAKRVRLCLYAVAAKVVSHGRRVSLKVQRQHHALLSHVLSRIRCLSTLIS